MTARSASSRSSTTAPSRRLAYDVLSRAPTAKDVEASFRRFHGALEAHDLRITTDGMGRLREALKELLAPGLEESLVFLDERLQGATSSAVERGNRRYRKMQKAVYRVRTRRGIEGRLALDLQRERRGEGRAETTRTLHESRAA